MPDANFEQMARLLDSTGEFRVLRRVPEPTIVSKPPQGDQKLAIILDTETTGLDPITSEVIELAMIAFLYNSNGSIEDVTATFASLREPSGPLSPEITKITGITPG